MQAPEFWQRDGFLATALQPLAWLYACLGRMRRAMSRPWTASVPVICVGNLVAGGTGKTPTALALGRALAGRGITAHFLSRGHGGRLGGRLRGPVKVDRTLHGAADVGDEPLLLAAAGPAWIARDRVQGARAAIAAGAQAIIMDDGFQNPGLAKDLSLLVIDSAQGLGNGRVHPAGPLRERPRDGLARADAVVLLQTGETPATLPAFEIPVLQARLIPGVAAEALRGQRVVAFAGIGRPARFFHTMRELGAELVGQQAFADHHAYGEDEIWALVEGARELDAIAVTTAKDAVRLPPGARDMVTVIDVTLMFDREDALAQLLDRVFLAAGS
jgi:tetraacyldisaccharide 4'-kinase